jgi:hypothetical protein
MMGTPNQVLHAWIGVEFLNVPFIIARPRWGHNSPSHAPL